MLRHTSIHFPLFLSLSLSLPLSLSAAYEPPPDILFTPPVERKVLTIRVRKVYSSEHGLKMRVSQTYWTGENKSHGLHICMCAAMHYSQTFPQVHIRTSIYMHNTLGVCWINACMKYTFCLASFLQNSDTYKEVLLKIQCTCYICN